MASKNSELRSKLGIARGLGAAKSGVSHWWWQRVSALALIPLSIWFLGAVIKVMTSPSVLVVASWFSSPFNAGFMVLFLLAVFAHAKLGVQVVIEDYCKSNFAKYSLLLANSFFCIAAAIFSVIAVLKLHFLDIAASSGAV